MTARTLGALWLAVAALSACRRSPPVADLILTDGRVHTLAWADPAPDGTPAARAPYDAAAGWRPDAEAVAIRAGRIEFVGSDDSALSYRGDSTRVIDLGGKTVIPGLIDASVDVPALAAGAAPESGGRAQGGDRDSEGPTNRTDRVRRALDSLAAGGFTMVGDAGADRGEMHALEALERSATLPVRVYGMLPARDTAFLHAWYDRGPDTVYTGSLIVRTVRLTAAGIPDTLAVVAMMTHNWQLSIEAVGAAANRSALDFIQREMATNAVAAHTRPLIEGTEFVGDADRPRLVSAGVIVSTDPLRAMARGSHSGGPAGASDSGEPVPWRSLRRAGARLVLTDDRGIDGADIFSEWYAAITRRPRAVAPEAHAIPSASERETLTPEEALRGFTSWASYAAYDEGETGRIAPSMRADLTVLTVDPLAVTPATADQLLAGSVAMTIVDGRVVFTR